MDEDLSRQERQLAAASSQIDELDKSGRHHEAQRLRTVHQRVAADLARLRQAVADDWRSMRADALAATRELAREMGSVDAKLTGWYEDELVSLDQAFEDTVRDADQMKHPDVPVEDSGYQALEAQIAEARKRRAEIASTPLAERQEAVDRYSAAVQDVIESWRVLSAHA